MSGERINFGSRSAQIEGQFGSANFHVSDKENCSYRIVNTRWTPSGEWMLDTIFMYILLTICDATFLSHESNLMSVLLKML